MENQELITKVSEKLYCDRFIKSVFGHWSETEVFTVYSRALCDAIAEILETLPDLEKRVMKIYLTEGKSKEEIAGILGMDPEEIVCAFAKAMRMLRHPSRAKRFHPFFIILEDDVSKPISTEEKK